MREGRASRTAEQNALFRALESLRPERERVCDDQLARHFLSWPFTLVIRAAAIPGVGGAIRSFIDRRWPGVRTSVVARTRLIDDAIAQALQPDIEQLVILGAGFDSRAYRVPRLRELDVFEVDHPDTQAAKRAVLDRLFSIRPGTSASSRSTSRETTCRLRCVPPAIAIRHARSSCGKASRIT